MEKLKVPVYNIAPVMWPILFKDWSRENEKSEEWRKRHGIELIWIEIE